MKTDEIREKYLQFFQSKGHRRCASDVLVPKDDDSVLFTPAGMNQFKDHFLGKVQLEFTRATTCQKCFRTGDIDNVGRTAFHHTFFEMLGNFSFGDYFKRDAIVWAWEFLTDPKWLGIDPDRLFVTVYLDDDEAAELWQREIGLPLERILRKDEDENFWPASAPSLGPNGVCGPCSEIYYRLDDGSDVEVWNLVFTQFNRVGQPPNNLQPLPNKNIDTGMGLERIASVLQNVPTNYHIDSLFPIVLAAGEICNAAYSYDSDAGRRLRRITDHVRAATFAIHENVVPSNEKQGYQIRLLLRRAILDGYQLGLREPALFRLVPTIAQQMKAAYPELSDTQGNVQAEIRREEEQYLRLLTNAVPFLEKELQQIQAAGQKVLSGAVAFDWYQTDGIPRELSAQMCERFGLTFDVALYEQAKAQHAEDSGKGQKDLFASGPLEDLKTELRSTEFLGYETSECQATVKGIIFHGQRRQSLADLDGRPADVIQSALKTDESIVQVVLDRSPFYAESGGQVGDSGWLKTEAMRFEIVDTQKASGLIVHYGVLREGQLTEDLQVTASVDFGRRESIRRAHSATHLLHYALQQNVGKDAQQRGSKVEDDRLRFDFKCESPIGAETLTKMETRVRQAIADNDPVVVRELPIAEARKAGAMMLFGEKYPEVVRMVSIGNYSKELCGGTHLESLGDLQAFEILSDESVSAGTRRITAITGRLASEFAEHNQTLLQQLADQLRVSAVAVVPALVGLREFVKDLKKQISNGEAKEMKWSPPRESGILNAAATKLAIQEVARILNVAPETTPQRVASLLEEVDSLQSELSAISLASHWSPETILEAAQTIGDGMRVVILETPGANANMLRNWADQLRRQESALAVFLASGQSDGKVSLVAALSRDLVDNGVSAGDWVRQVAPVVGGGGGGKPDLAQAGGKDPGQIKAALIAADQYIKAKLAV